MKDLISAIIPTYNRSSIVVNAVESVLSQTDKNFELIVVDDGSTDDTRIVLEKYNSSLRYIFQENKGPSAARNRGLTESRGEYIAYLDSDDLWVKTKLQKQRRLFESDPSMLICHTEEMWIRNGVRVNQMNKHKKGGGDLFAKALELCIVSPSAVMMKKALFDEVGLWDETLHFAEDYDLWLRILSKYPIGYIEEPLVIKHGGHADQQSRKFIGGDKYRIYAIRKILDSGTLNREQTINAVTELRKKSQIYGKGCIKHGREDEGGEYLSLALKCEEIYLK